MPRAESTFIREASKHEVFPILFARVIDIPTRNNPSLKVSIYLTDAQSDISFFDENDNVQLFTACALSYDQAKAGTSNEIDQVVVRIDNVDNTFTALAQNYELNGVWVQLLQGFSNLLSSPAAARVIFDGHIKSAVIREYALEATVQADFSLAVSVPRRLYSVDRFPLLPSSKDPRSTPIW